MSIKIKHLVLAAIFIGLTISSVNIVKSATTSDGTVQTQRRIDPCAGKTCGCGTLPTCKQTATPETKNKVKPEIKGYFSCDKEPKTLWETNKLGTRVNTTCEFKVVGAENPAAYKFRTMSECMEYKNGKVSSVKCKGSASAKIFSANTPREIVDYSGLLLKNRVSVTKCYVVKIENGKERIVLNLTKPNCYEHEFVIPE